MTTSASFARRQNQDSSIDSICTKCYQTVASSDLTSEFSLASAERNHVCNVHGEFNHPLWQEVHRAA